MAPREKGSLLVVFEFSIVSCSNITNHLMDSGRGSGWHPERTDAASDCINGALLRLFAYLFISFAGIYFFEANSTAVRGGVLFTLHNWKPETA